MCCGACCVTGGSFVVVAVVVVCALGATNSARLATANAADDEFEWLAVVAVISITFVCRFLRSLNNCKRRDEQKAPQTTSNVNGRRRRGLAASVLPVGR